MARISRPMGGSWRRGRAVAGGFTLLELLVVIAIVGVLLTLAVLATGDPRAERGETEARRLAALLELAVQEAVLRAQPIGIAVTEADYRFFRMEGGRWRAWEGDETWRRRPLPEGVRPALQVAGSPVVLPGGDETPEGPQVWFLPDGRYPAFELRMDDGETRWGVRGDLETGIGTLSAVEGTR